VVLIHLKNVVVSFMQKSIYNHFVGRDLNISLIVKIYDSKFMDVYLSFLV